MVYVSPMAQFVFVSFDIDSHGAEPDLAKQVERVARLNDLVGVAICAPEAKEPLWASGGDGGHIAFTPAGAAGTVPGLLKRLRDWSVEFDVPLRIVGHVGDSSTVRGADGRTQLVGHGINLCGSLLEVAFKEAIVVTASFATFFEGIPSSRLRFHDPRNIYLKHFRMTPTCLCSLEGAPASSWKPLHRSDRSMLVEAMKAHSAWDVIYYARRIIQTNSEDAEAKTIITNTVLNHYGDLVPRKKGLSVSRLSLFSTIDPPSFLLFITAAELVERRDGEVLCNQHDAGDTMFLVLRGELAVAAAPLQSKDTVAPATQMAEHLTFGPGDVVGELAVSLKTNRTATLQAVGNVSVLSFSYQSLRKFVTMHRGNARFSQALSTFIDIRVLDYVCNHAPYLIGLDGNGPLGSVIQPWEYLSPFSTRLDFAEGAQINASDERLGGPGIYIAASGTLSKSVAGMPAKEHVDGSALYPVFVDFPNRIVNRFAAYTVRSASATLIHIAEPAFIQWGVEKFDQIVGQLGKALAVAFEYDIFVSFSLEDHKLAMEIKLLLEAKGLSVYLDTVAPGKAFSRYLEGAILSSLVFLVLCTPMLERKQQMGEQTWVEREVAFRKAAFVGERNLLPLRIGGARIPDFLVGISYLDVPPIFDSSFVSEIHSLVDEIKEGQVTVPSARVPFVMPSLMSGLAVDKSKT
jgi:hypothetical protein